MLGDCAAPLGYTCTILLMFSGLYALKKVIENKITAIFSCLHFVQTNICTIILTLMGPNGTQF